jgi:hypothetical protein
MLKAIKEFFMGKPAVPAEVPYKVEVSAPPAPVVESTPEPAATTPIPLAVETAPVADKPKKTPAPKKTAAPKKTPAPKKTAPKKAAK